MLEEHCPGNMMEQGPDREAAMLLHSPCLGHDSAGRDIAA